MPNARRRTFSVCIRLILPAFLLLLGYSLTAAQYSTLNTQHSTLAAGAPPVTTEQQAALDRVNAYRQRVGLAPLRLDVALNRAAVGHATYYVLNAAAGGMTGMGLHSEQPAQPGFIGATIYDRIKGQGYKGSGNEGIDLLGDPVAAVDDLMDTVDHRLPMIAPFYTDLGYGGNNGTRLPLAVFTYGGQSPYTVPPEFVAYPADGMTGITPTYNGDGTSLAFPDAHYPVGTAITLQYTGPGTPAITSAHLSGPDGADVPIYTRFNYGFIARNVLVLAAQQPLQPGRRYTVRIDGTRPAGPFTQVWSFVTGSGGPLGPPPAPPDAPFIRVWAHTDWPLAASLVNRSWVWGPAPFDTRAEPYREGAGGVRQVQYYDKTRMEINDPTAPANSPFLVSNGLLVVEMVSGQVQVGRTSYETRAPSQEPVAGDTRAVNPDAPSYAAMRTVASLAGNNGALYHTGQPLVAYLDARGVAGNDVRLAGYGAQAGHYVPETQHNIADKFWTYLNAAGPIYDAGNLRTLPLFAWIAVTGYPISEPYWVTADIAGQPTAVLVQLFQRRVLTYTPSFAPAWQVQMGNVGRHYHAWRYGN
ncbi:MAG: CAP domain-containing protein [Chloroflexota bacterium]|nr:CAP domain-containing protein [Chloroflexota bacterium]